MRTMIVEDSILARDELKFMLQDIPQLTLCGEAEDANQALPIIDREKPQAIFMDINMPGKNGFELLAALDYSPKVIFTTAHAEHAARSFDFDVVDYLLKPYSYNRLKLAIDKLLCITDKKSESELMDIAQHLLLRDGEKTYWVRLKDIYYFESCVNHSLVVWGKNKALVYRALGSIENRLPESHFVRANRKHIVNIDHVDSVEAWINGGYRLRLGSLTHIEVSRRQASRFKEQFSL